MSEAKPPAAPRTLADYLEERQEVITQRWVEAVRRAPDLQSPDEVTYQQLINHVPQIYRRMIELLRHSGSAARASEARQDARIHGQHRWEQGYRLDELLREVDILRQILLVEECTEFAHQFPDSDPALAKRERNIISGVLSELTNSSVQQFITEAEQQIRRQNEELARANQRLKELDEARLRLMLQLAHELNNLLNGIYTPVALLDKGVDAAMGAKMIAILRRKTTDMATLVRDLLSYSTLLAGREELRVETFDVSPLCNEMETTFRPAAEAKGLALELTCDPALSAVTGDPLKVKQVINNLLSNAIKYTDAGRVALTLRPRADQQWAILVEDTGRGIAPEELQHIFAEFHRSAPQAEVGGTGLGLAITKQLVELLGGSIQVESTPERGSRFEVTLPRTYPPN
jgi:signal transduction histidine kinase